MLKRVIAVLLICLSVCGIAYSDYDNSILFRNISWGTTIDEVEKLLLGDGIEIRSVNEYDGGTGFRYSSLSDIMLMDTNFAEKYGNYMYYKTFSPHKVAGYDVYATYGYFAYLPDENNIITKDRELTSFMLGCYEIVPTDMDYATNDIMEKLKSIYGDYDSTGIHNSAFKYTFYLWRSRIDRTFLTLIRMDSTMMTSSRIYIYYGTFVGNDLMNTARDLQEEFDKKTEINNSQSGGTDGL